MSAADPVLEWNTYAEQTLVGQNPVVMGRILAITQVSVYDAVNSITGQAEPYAVGDGAPAGASLDAAAIAAAHKALVVLVPASAATLDAQFAASLSSRGLSVSDPGVAHGESVANQILALRAQDGAEAAQFPYTPPGAGDPGVWQPTPASFAPALVPGWGAVTTWVLRSGDQFRPPPPPALDSQVYTRDFNEVKAFGALNSAVRTPEQTNIGKFWLANNAVIWYPVARQVAAARHLSVFESARLFALLTLAQADAAIAVFDAKYTYNQWRPVTAIHRAAEDGNDATQADPTWEPLAPTPPFPDYVSGHASVSSATATVLEDVFGDDPGVDFVATSPTNPGFVRHWNTFSTAVDEVNDARVYAGFHWRYSDKRGAIQGRQVANFLLHHALRMND